MDELVKKALINSVVTAAYVTGVALFMNWGSTMKIGRVNTFLAPMALLLLFVFSAAFTSFMIFGKPAQMYIDGKKKEALKLLSYTLMFFFVITLAALIFLVLLTR